MPLTDKKRITNDRYLSKFATKSIRIPKEIEEDLNTAAAHAVESVAGYIVNATRERMARDGFQPPAPDDTPEEGPPRKYDAKKEVDTARRRVYLFFVARFPWGVFRGRLSRGGSMMPRR